MSDPLGPNLTHIRVTHFYMLNLNLVLKNTCDKMLVTKLDALMWDLPYIVSNEIEG